jgi:hypothetical protein
MALAKYTPDQEKKMLERNIAEIESKDIKGWIARMARHYEIKKLKNRIKEIEKSLPARK